MSSKAAGAACGWSTARGGLVVIVCGIRLLRFCPGDQARRRTPHARGCPTRADLLADVYIKTEVMRLFGLRNFWLTYAQRPRSYEGPQLSYYRKDDRPVDDRRHPRGGGTGSTHHRRRRGARPRDSWSSSSATASWPCIPGGTAGRPAREHGAAHRDRPRRARGGGQGDPAGQAEGDRHGIPRC